IEEKYKYHKIVPLSLQILFENAIKHNIISKNKPLTIEVFVNDWEKLPLWETQNHLAPEIL
ncbi:MAG: hypothetical protein ACPG7F_11390, partial [Aggregatilineales bacterium]